MSHPSESPALGLCTSYILGSAVPVSLYKASFLLYKRHVLPSSLCGNDSPFHARPKKLERYNVLSQADLKALWGHHCIFSKDSTRKKDKTCFISQLILFRSPYQMAEVEIVVPEATRLEKVGMARALDGDKGQPMGYCMEGTYRKGGHALAATLTCRTEIKLLKCVRVKGKKSNTNTNIANSSEAGTAPLSPSLGVNRIASVPQNSTLPTGSHLELLGV